VSEKKIVERKKVSYNDEQRANDISHSIEQRLMAWEAYGLFIVEDYIVIRSTLGLCST
jgi:hypothetical protein